LIFTPKVNQQLAVKLGLNADQAILMYAFVKLPNWARKESIEGVDYFYLAVNKIMAELPLVCTSSSKAHRLIKVLINKKLINRIEHLNNSYYNLTALGQTWENYKHDKIVSDSEVTQGVSNLGDSNADLEQESFKDNSPSPLELGDNNNTNNTNTNNKNISIDSFFDEFWIEYPKKLGKAQTLKKFRQRKMHKQQPQILQALKNYKRTKTVEDGFIFNASKFLDNFEDYINGIPEGIKTSTTQNSSNSQKKSPNEGGEIEVLVTKLKTIFTIANQKDKPSEALSKSLDEIKTTTQEPYFLDIEKRTINELGGLVVLERGHHDDGFKLEIQDAYLYIKNSQMNGQV